MRRVILLVVAALASTTDAVYYCSIPSENFKTEVPPKAYRNGFPVGSKVHFYCPKGFRLRGKEVSECLADGWSTNAPKCVKKGVTCARRDVEHGSISSTKSSFPPGSEIIYSCDLGYYLIGKDTDICQDDGKWKEKDSPICYPITCPKPEVPSNGKLDSNYKYYFPDEEIKFSCEEGYKLKGDKKTECQENGKWKYENEPKCVKAITCPRLNAPINLEISPDKSEYSPNEMVLLLCKDGYYVNGLAFNKCMENGDWRFKKVPRCKRALCYRKDLSQFAKIDPDHEIYLPGETVNVYCDDGDILFGEREITCQNNRQWRNLPVCTKVTCPMRSAPSNGNVRSFPMERLPGERITYDCNDGFELKGRDHNICLGDGTWKYHDAPVCVKLERCSFKRPPSHGEVSPERKYYPVGKHITFSCDDKYYLVGPEENVCEEGGEWKFSQTPICQKYCFVVSNELDDNLIHLSEHSRFKLEEQTSFICKSNMVLVGQDTIHCGDGGRWQQRIPKCVRVCNRPVVEHGRVEDEETRVYSEGDVVRFLCDQYYQLEKATTAKCLADGTWNREASCKRLKQPQCIGEEVRNGGTRPGKKLYNDADKVRYFCSLGHTLTENISSNECTSDGTWKHPVPDCKKSGGNASCNGRCRIRSDYRRFPCQCNLTCKWFDNCCSDYGDVCSGSSRG